MAVLCNYYLANGHTVSTRKKHQMPLAQDDQSHWVLYVHAAIYIRMKHSVFVSGYLYARAPTSKWWVIFPEWLVILSACLKTIQTIIQNMAESNFMFGTTRQYHQYSSRLLVVLDHYHWVVLNNCMLMNINNYGILRTTFNNL